MPKTTEKKAEAKTTVATAESKEPMPVEKAAADGVAAFAARLRRYRILPPSITSKRATQAAFQGAQILVDALRTEAIGKANNGRVDVDDACDAANLAIGKAAKAFDVKGVPAPFDTLVDADTLQRVAIPVLRAALIAWNNQLSAPPKKKETL